MDFKYTHLIIYLYLCLINYSNHLLSESLSLAVVGKQGSEGLELINKILHLTLTMAQAWVGCLSLLFTMLVREDCEGLKSLVEHADDTVLDKVQRELMLGC